MGYSVERLFETPCGCMARSQGRSDADQALGGWQTCNVSHHYFLGHPER